MTTHRFTFMTVAKPAVCALALILAAANATSATAREYSGERSWSGKANSHNSTNDTRRGTEYNHRNGGSDSYRPSKPVVVDNDDYHWRGGNDHGRGHGRYNRWHRFDRDGDFRRARWQRRHWWHRYW